MTEVEGITRRRGREGSRWINERPTGEEVAAWFTENVPMHEGMDPADFIGGVTIIPAKEKYDAIRGYNEQTGAPILQEMQALTFTPYLRVDTRVRYFWAWMEKHPDWLGVIERVATPEQDPHLPIGFFYQTVTRADGKEVRFIGCCMRVAVYKREGTEEVFSAPAATKMVPVLNRFGEDVNAMMKAETGAIGRALGFAGILVAPGSGIATAEDVQESMGLSQGAGATEPQEPQLPPEPSEQELRQIASDRLNELQERSPQAFEQFSEWAQSRDYKSLADIDVPQLKGVIRKLDRVLDETVGGEAETAVEDGPALVDAPKEEPAPDAEQ